MRDLEDIRTSIHEMLKDPVPPLRIRKDNDTEFEVAGTKPAMQGKQKVDGYYFASVVPKPKDIRLYFFPIYTHPKEFEWLSDGLRKCLKGKSCFHIKRLDDQLIQEVDKMIKTGIDAYVKDGLI